MGSPMCGGRCGSAMWGRRCRSAMCGGRCGSAMWGRPCGIADVGSPMWGSRCWVAKVGSNVGRRQGRAFLPARFRHCTYNQFLSQARASKRRARHNCYFTTLTTESLGNDTCDMNDADQIERESIHQVMYMYTHLVVVVFLMTSFAFLPWAIFCNTLCTVGPNPMLYGSE